MRIKNLIAPLVGILLLVILFYNFDFKSIAVVFSQVNIYPSIIALLLVILSTIICSLRWNNILEQKGIKYKIIDLIRLNFESITIISIVPAGLAGVEAWRLTALYNINKNEFKTSAPTIIIDRLSGMWGLSIISLSGLLILQFSKGFFFINNYITYFYFLLLLSFVLIPILNRLLIFVLSKIKYYSDFFHYVIRILNVSFFYKIFFYSVLNQFLLMVSFWLCSIAVGVNLSFLTVMSLGLVIMLPSIIPFSFLGYGPREIGVVFLLSFYFIPKEEALVISLIYGFLTTSQGLLGLPFFYQRIKLLLQNKFLNKFRN